MPQAPPASTPAAAALARAQACLVQVQSVDLGRPNHRGGGIVVAPWTVATSAHVVLGHAAVEVRQGARVWTVRARREDLARDLCLLYVPELDLPQALLGDPESSQVGQPVFSLGFPGSTESLASAGRLQGKWCFRGGLILQSDAATGPGSSGGGLFDEKGLLLGLNTFTFPDQPRLSFAVPVSWVKELEASEARDVQGAPPLSSDFLHSLAADPSNWPQWVEFARAWVRSAPGDEKGWTTLGQALDARRRQLEDLGLPEVPEGPLALEAQAAYRHALDLKVENARAWNNIGVAQDARNRFDEALQSFQNAVDLWPDYGLAWNNLGKAAFNAHRHSLALDAFRRGLELVPDDASAWAFRADCESSLGLPHDQEASLAIAARLRPYKAELWLELGQVRWRLRMGAGALECLARLERMASPLAEVLRGGMKPATRRRLRSGRSPSGAA